MSEQTYKKVMHGKSVRYIPVPTEMSGLNSSMTAGEIVTAVGTLGVLCINGYRLMLDAKSCSANRVKGVEDAVLKMFKDTGSPIDHAITQHVCEVWNQTMLTLDGGIDT
jgi:hypothetical protein